MKNILYQESIVENKHLFHIMKITALILFIFVGTTFATETYSQTMKVTVVADKISTDKVIHEIEKQTDYLFVYKVNEVNLKRTVQVNAENKSVAEVLNKVFEGTDIYYAMEGKNIMLMSKAKAGVTAQQTNKVTGVVKDKAGITLRRAERDPVFQPAARIQKLCALLSQGPGILPGHEHLRQDLL